MSVLHRHFRRAQTSVLRRYFSSEGKRYSEARKRDWPALDTSEPPKPRPAQPLPVIPPITPDDQFYKSLQDPNYFQTANLFTVRQLMDARVHLGHKVGTLNNFMKPFLIGERLGVCVFDLDQTAIHLRLALNFVAHMAYRNGIIVFFGGDSWNIHAIEQAAKEAGEFSHCRRFVPDSLVEAKTMFGNVIRHPDLGIFCTTMESVFEPHKALVEFKDLSIPTVGVVDSNCDPTSVTFPIPGNDDSPTAIRFYLHLFKEAIRKGKEKAKIDFPEMNVADKVSDTENRLGGVQN